MTAIKTYRRDKLWRLLQAKRLVLAGSYSYDEMYGVTRTDQSKPMPCLPMPENRADCRDGTCYLGKREFESHGSAWLNPDGTVTLHVHSNSNYTFRILEVAP